MRFRNFGWGIVCIVALLALTVSGEIKPTAQSQVKKEVIPGGLADKIKLSPGIDKSWTGLVSLGEKILEDINALEKSYKDLKRGPGQIAELLDKRRGVISGERYELIYGKDSQGFWSKMQAERTTLEIQVAMIYVSNVTGPHPKLPFPEEVKIKPPLERREFNAVAFVIVEFHFVNKTKEGAVVHNETYSGELGYRHQLDCQWEY